MPSSSRALKRQMQSTRRNSQQGVAMSLEKRPPRELLNRIGISGKDVVKIIKERNWIIEEPHGLQQQNIYHVPGSESKGDAAKHNKDFFVGEGELYAFILRQGGVRYLLPDESDVSDLEPTQPSKTQPLKQAQPLKPLPSKPSHSFGGTMTVKEKRLMEDKDERSSAAMTEVQRKWKRRKKLSTARSESVEKMPPTIDLQRKASERSSSDDGSSSDDQDSIRIDPRVKLERTTYGNIGQHAEFHEYEASWKARGWRAQMLQDIDVHMLRSVAAVDRRHRALENFKHGPKTGGRPTNAGGPHVKDATEISQEVEGLLFSIRASQEDISSMIEAIIVEAERLAHPDRVDSIGRIGIPGFVSTGAEALMLVRDIERYLLLVVAAVRRYRRARKACTAEKCANGLKQAPGPIGKRTKLRSLQLSIEESKSEIQELATIIAAEARRSVKEDAQPETEKRTP